MKTPVHLNGKEKIEESSQLFNFKKSIISILCIITLFFPFHNTKAQTFTAQGFSQVLVANGISSPTVMAFAPDGRIFVAQQTGQLRVIKNGVLLAQSFVNLSVHSSGERGLLGIAFHPRFNIDSNYIYLYYTLPSGTNNRISRFTANGDVAVPGSEFVLLDLAPLSSATNHNGGTMQFGPDGKLYVGIGENAFPDNAQNLDTYHGKLIRINSDGTVPTGNPFTTGSQQRQRVWAYGLRNPYTLTFQPGTGKLFVNDVGQNAWEEINDATTGGKNFGWPTVEGTNPNPAFINPVYAYGHGTGPGIGCAITGGSFFNPPTTNYPSTFTGKYFYIDYCGNWIDMLTISGSTVTRSNFASSIAGFPVSIVTGPDGNLYFLSRTNSAVYKITYTSSSAPVITNQPQSITVAEGNPATFSVTATGTAPLTYQWRKNGINISGATNSVYTIASVVPAHAGSYSVVVSNSAGNATSNAATLTVTPANQSPTASITTPGSGSTYGGGQVINFSGSATDPEQGSLGASSFSWYVVFHHDSHTHPGPSAPSGVTSGSFTIPNSGETSANVFYRLYLVVTDAQGADDTAFVDILPRTSTITLNTNPQGLTLTLDGQPVTAPITVTSVEGILRSIGAPSPQTFNNTNYYFSSWSQGGSQTQTFATPVNNATYTASFSTPPVTLLNPIADAYVRSGNTNNTNYGSSTELIARNNTVAKGIYLTYLRFDISSLTNFSSVKLRLFGNIDKGRNSTATIQVFHVASNIWQENTITYTNKPSEQTTVLAAATINGTTPQYYEWDLTQHISNLRSTGAAFVSLLVKNPIVSNNLVIFNSREQASNKPELKITGGISSPVTRFRNSVEASGSDPVFYVYPNPAANNLMLQFSPEFKKRKLQIVDITGRVIKELLITGMNEQIINISEIKDGMYFLYIESKNKKYAQKILIAK